MLYLDNAAAARPDAEVLDYFRECASRHYVNQEAAHGAARRLRMELTEAGERLSWSVAGRLMSVHWAMSGTELFGFLAAFPLNSSGNVVTSRFEHPALTASLHRVAKEVNFLNWDVERNTFDAGCVNDKTRLLAVHHVQSETGRIIDVDDLASRLRERSPDALLLADTIQSAGKLPLPESADLLTISGHKLGAPGGAALLINSEWKCLPLMQRALQKMRSDEYLVGRPEPSLLLTLAFAAELRARLRDREQAHVRRVHSAMRSALADLVLPNRKRVVFTVPEEFSSPYILHLRFPGYQGGVLVRMLSEHGIYVSSGSACQAESRNPSPVLLAAGLSREDAYSGVRLSFSAENTPDDAVTLRNALEKVLSLY